MATPMADTGFTMADARSPTASTPCMSRQIITVAMRFVLLRLPGPFLTSMDNSQYGPNVDAMRPGGALSTAVVRPSALSNNASSPDSYYIVGDESSVSTVLNALVSQCDVANASVTNTYLNGTLPANGTVLVTHPEQIVQFYRASSFALALLSYNNSATLPANAPASNVSAAPPISADTPLPVGLNMTLFACLNSTIAASVPLLDVDGGQGLSVDQILWILFAIFVSVPLLLVLCKHCCWSRGKT